MPVAKLRKRLSQRSSPSRAVFLTLFIALEIVAGLHLWNKSHNEATLGYLVKHGGAYVVAWKEKGSPYQFESHNSLERALAFAREELKLGEGLVVQPDLAMEHIWVDDRFGSYVLLWKTDRTPLLNQITFQSQSDVQFFANAFKRGSYTPSPFGHSIFLIPTHDVAGK